MTDVVPQYGAHYVVHRAAARKDKSWRRTEVLPCG